jgi:phosphoribosylaminoimidazole-succinocarboxamide synthase
MRKGELLYAGKAKSLYKTDDESLLICEFRDDTSAFDGEKTEKLENKGRVNNAISTHIMKHLAEQGIKTHIHSHLSPLETVVKRLDMLPVECVVRNVAAGSLCRRLGIAQGLVLETPLFELFFKDDELHDPMINNEHAVLFGWANQDQIDTMRECSLKINGALVELFKEAGLTLIDAKYEFGVFNGEIILADEISPDSCRIWDTETQEKLDKDRFRQDMGDVIASYEKIAGRLGVELG